MRLLILVFPLLFIGCGNHSNNQQKVNDDIVAIDTTAVIEEGREISKAAFSTLSSNLKQALEEGGIEHALQFCNVEAMPLTDSLSANYGIELRRASHKPRNPANRADSLEMKTINQYLRQIEENGELKPVIHVRDKMISYHAPIQINNQLCLNCHGKRGTDITESNFETIQELYPEDEATGFEMGQLRGIWSIDFSKTE